MPCDKKTWFVVLELFTEPKMDLTRCAAVLILSLCLTSGCTRAPATAPPDKPVKPYEPPDERLVFFAPGRAELAAPDGFFALGYVVAVLDADPSLHVLIVGHAANEASPSYARELSLRRARSVRKTLTDHGVPARRILLGAPRMQQRADRPLLNQRADVYVYDPLQDEISKRLGYDIELRGE
jgi:hypothetical protein